MSERKVSWTKEHDAGIAFGAGLGMSARQIAASLGVTRNMVLGRIFRQTQKGNRGMTTSPYKRPKKAANRSGLRYWTEEELTILRDNPHLTAEELTVMLPRRSRSAIEMQRYIQKLPGAPHKRSDYYFTEEDRATIRADWMNNVPIEDIAAKLHRTVGSIKQQVFQMKLRRDARMVRLIKRFGIDIAKVSNDPTEIRRIIYEQEEAERAKISAAEAERIKAVLDQMEVDLVAGIDRKAAFRAALVSGATLQAVGDRCGITRERVRQIVHAKKPYYKPRAEFSKPCARCGQDFITRHDSKKYCEPCKPLAYYEKVMARNKALQEAKKKILKARGCRDCGADINDRGLNAIYCVPCAATKALRNRTVGNVND